ncbi:MAG: 4Fe-4S dicluster domain-containing protein [Desulfobacteraceae bacterium]|jgi:sulfhydrogenase subunit beta (sulfur reductase)|nr:4Fe-4S dicluster domain-containing protein [Desulfobacteraceae bacterium]
MKLIKIDRQSLNDGIEKSKADYRVFGPVKEKNDHEFKLLEKSEIPDLNFQNTRLSPKSIIYPQSQVMFTYSLDESKDDCRIMKEVENVKSPMAIFGIRPCDALAFPIVRRNFDTPEYQDTYWVKAYEATTFIGLACNSACNSACGTCFCTSAGTGPFGEEGLDVLLIADGDIFYAKSITAKGEAFIQVAGWSTEADPSADSKIDDLKTAAETSISSSVNTDNLKNKTILELYDAPFWEQEAFSCINCGTCTYVCPTCWCFDVQDETHGKSGIRMRNWDSCMFPLFTQHASGHNPRDVNYARLRQRFMHKLKYYVDKYDKGIQCVGCGRCIRLCPVNIDIRRICNKMNSFDAADCVCETTSS